MLGAIGTALSGSAPGTVLGIFVILGSVAGTVAVYFRRAYLIIPVPALSYVVAAGATGFIHDRSVDISRTALAVSATQWIASGFVWMTTATILVIAITAVRWLARRNEPDARASRVVGGAGPGGSVTGISSGQSRYRR